MKILIIDDEEYRHQGFKKYFSMHDCTHVYSYDEAMLAIQNNEFDAMFFDNDLAGDRPQTDGINIAHDLLWNFPEAKWPKVVWVHSWNTMAAQNIASLFQSAQIKTYVLPYDFNSLDAWQKLVASV